MTERPDSKQFALAAAELAANTRCEDVVVLDLRGRSPVTEFFVIATGTSPRQMRTVVDEAADLGKKLGFAPWKMEGYESARWIVMDCVSVVIHVLDFESRDYYDLELLWGEESAQVDWRKALGLPPAPAGASRAAERAGRALAGSEGESGGRLRRGLLEEATEDDETDDLVEVEAAGGDADLDEDAEVNAPVMTEVAEEESEGVELVEIDPPTGRAGGGKTVFPVQVVEEEELESAVHVMRESVEEEEELEVQAVEKKSHKPRKKPVAKAKPAARKKPAVKKKPAPQRKAKIARKLPKKKR